MSPLVCADRRAGFRRNRRAANDDLDVIQACCLECFYGCFHGVECKRQNAGKGDDLDVVFLDSFYDLVGRNVDAKVENLETG